uniref:hypothetical protein n=1 Tax=Crenothrix polyspora TaxID=360316 RepID=UPI0015C62941|nr:hypothetical protein [Crenothrix polyspora]
MRRPKTIKGVVYRSQKNFTIVCPLQVWDYRHLGLAFSLGGGLGMCWPMAFTVSGVPFGWWSTNRFYLFGGRLRTGHPGECFAALAIALICGYIATHSEPMDLGNGSTDKPITKQFFPFFYDHHDNYQRSLIDCIGSA